jgi:dimethylhistidine N-methyltransferase
MRRSAAYAADASAARFAGDVRAGLTTTPKRLPPRWFYDALGSSLFESICQLPWYRITRAESALLERHAIEIADAAGDAASIIELGGGSGEKLALILDGFEQRGFVTRVHLVDVSARALELASATLGRFSRTTFFPVEATYEEGLRVAVTVPGGPRQLVAFLGSNIGNFDPPGSAALVQHIAAALRAGDLFLLGTDLVKEAAALLRAYDDPLGVTAAFNKNVLQRMNAELGANFDLTAFSHEARWDDRARRVEMHLTSVRPQVVEVPAAGITVPFERGESIWTESSYKYDKASIAELGRAAGCTIRDQWIDQDALFALTLFERR